MAGGKPEEEKSYWARVGVINGAVSFLEMYWSEQLRLAYATRKIHHSLVESAGGDGMTWLDVMVFSGIAFVIGCCIGCMIRDSKERTKDR